MSETIEMQAELQAANAKRRAEFIEGLHELAAFLETHPTVPVPYDHRVDVFISTREEMAKIARVASWEKRYGSSWFALAKRFGEYVSLEVNINRDTVCHKVVIGMRTVPAVEAQPEREEPVEEWVCDEVSLLEVK